MRKLYYEGKKYHNNDPKIAICGNSWYDDGKIERDNNYNPIKVCWESLDPKIYVEYEPWMRTYIRILKLYSGDPTLHFRDPKIIGSLESIFFYNLSCKPMSKPREKPTSKDYKDSYPVFWNYLNYSEADLLIVLGKDTYRNLPQAGYQGPDIFDRETWIYTLKSGKECLVFPVVHPAAYSFSINEEICAVQEAIKYVNNNRK